MTTIDEIFADDRSNPPAERSLPWEETHGTVTVVVEPKPHWASDMRAFRRTEQTYCYYADWTENGRRARFYGHIDTSGDGRDDEGTDHAHARDRGRTLGLRGRVLRGRDGFGRAKRERRPVLSFSALRRTSSMSTQVATSHFATLVPDHRRGKFLPTLFGHRLFIVAEAAVYTIMERLSPDDYRGGFWNFYEHHDQPLFLAPTSRPRYRIESGLTEFRGEVSAEAAGIIATMFTLSHLTFQYEFDLLVESFHRLRDNLDGHPEASEIFQAID